MSDTDHRSPWWAGIDALESHPDGVPDPWSESDRDVGLSSEQVRFLEVLADQPHVPRLTDGIPGLDPGIGPADETGD